MTLKSFYKAVCAAAVAAALATPAAATDVVLRLGSIVAPASVQALAMDRFAELVAEKNVGIEVRLFHNSQLGAGPEQVRNVQLGIQEMFMDGMVFWGDFSDDMRLAETPFSFASREHFEAWVTSEAFDRIQEEIIAQGNQRLINLEVPWRRGPFRVLVSTKPMTGLDDFRSLRVRTWQSEVINRYYGPEGLGATTIVLPLGDVYVGMRQGLVDAVTLPLDLVVPLKFGEVASHVVIWNEFWQVLPMSISETVWASLNDEQRNALTEAANEAGEFYNASVTASVESWLAELRANGVDVTEIERNEFVEIIEARNREWQAEGYWRAGLIDEVEALK